ncbi:MAG: hypothetical protein M3R52_13030, partial [Acidobacteriota bacterium]|nr:hypothetical protein [Acidobacteriota bacterium]
MRKTMSRKKRTVTILVLLLTSLIALPQRFRSWLETPVFAATFTVSNTDDSGAGSLRQAIIDANVSAGTDVISFNIPSGAPGCVGTPNI